MARLAHHAHHLVHFVARAQLLRADQQANGPLRKILHQLLDDGNGGVLLVGDIEQNFKVGVILPAKAGVVLVGFTVKALNRLNNADWRSEIARRRRTPEKSPGRDRGHRVVTQRRNRADQNYPTHEMPQVAMHVSCQHRRDARADQRHASRRGDTLTTGRLRSLCRLN